MKSAKLGTIFMISIMALAGIGVGYAAWTDIITIDGTINTGDVEWHFFDYSGTEVWKVWGSDAPPNEIYVRYWPGMDPVNIAYPDSYGEGKTELIAWASAAENGDDHHATVEYANLFPSIDFEADVWVIYTGSVPGKINSITFNDPWTNDPNDPDHEEEMIDSHTDLFIDIYDDQHVKIADDIDPELLYGYQLHEDYEIHAIMRIHLPQDPAYMNLFGDFDVSVEVVQWNEWPYP